MLLFAHTGQGQSLVNTRACVHSQHSYSGQQKPLPCSALHLWGEGFGIPTGLRCWVFEKAVPLSIQVHSGLPLLFTLHSGRGRSYIRSRLLCLPTHFFRDLGQNPFSCLLLPFRSHLSSSHNLASVKTFLSPSHPFPQLSRALS